MSDIITQEEAASRMQALQRGRNTRKDLASRREMSAMKAHMRTQANELYHSVPSSSQSSTSQPSVKRSGTIMPGMSRMPPPPGWMEQGLKALEEKLASSTGVDKWRHHTNQIRRTVRMTANIRAQQELSAAERWRRLLLSMPVAGLCIILTALLLWLLLVVLWPSPPPPPPPPSPPPSAAVSQVLDTVIGGWADAFADEPSAPPRRDVPAGLVVAACVLACALLAAAQMRHSLAVARAHELLPTGRGSREAAALEVCRTARTSEAAARSQTLALLPLTGVADHARRLAPPSSSHRQCALSRLRPYRWHSTRGTTSRST